MLPGSREWRHLCPEMDLAGDQIEAISRILATFAIGQKEAVLNGPAGTGKSTLTRYLTNLFSSNGWGVLLLAPTGRAVARLYEITHHHSCTTIHSALYGSVAQHEGKPVFGKPHWVCPPGTLVVIDEASMIHPTLYAEMMTYIPERSVVLFAGDNEQLPPVDENQGKIVWGPNFESPTATLTTIHRQAAGSEIIQLATSIREGVPLPLSSFTNEVSSFKETLSSVVARQVEWLENGYDGVTLAWTNETRRAINSGCRVALRRRNSIEVGERVLIRSNNKGAGLMNGELYEVQRVTYLGAQGDRIPPLCEVWLKGKPRPILIAPSQIGIPREEFGEFVWKGWSRGEYLTWIARMVHIDYGYAITVHAAQGSEFDRVCYVADSLTRSQRTRNFDFWKRLTYTAFTRAKNHLVVSNI